MNNNYHIFKNGELVREDDNLRFNTEGEAPTYIPIKQVEAIYSHGQIDVNTRLLSFLNEEQVELHVFGWAGQYSGTFLPQRGQVSGATIVGQVSAYTDDTHRREIASEIVESSIHNMRNIIQYRQREGESTYQSLLTRLDAVEQDLASAQRVTEILGIEAQARKIYYAIYRQEVAPEFSFDKREYRPPPDAINSMISYGNTILYSQCTSAIRSTALDPTISFVHEPGERRCSLALDIADLFKPLLVDRIILALVNTKQLTQDDFNTEAGVCTIDEEKRRLFLKRFEQRLQETVDHPTLKRKTSYQYLIQNEVYKLKKHILAGEPYNGFKKWW